MKSNLKKLVKSHPLVLVDFHATWCKPCKALSPILADISKETKGKVKVIKIDVDQNQKLAADMNIRSVPTLTFYKYGKQEWRQSGAPTKNELLKSLKAYL